METKTVEELTKELAEANEQIERWKQHVRLINDQFELLVDIIIDARVEAEVVNAESGIGNLAEFMGEVDEIYDTYTQRKAERIAKTADLVSREETSND